MRDRRGQTDVAQALATYLGLNDLDTALFADHPSVLHALVLAAVALVVLHRPKDLGAEQAVALGLEGSVVDGLRLFDLAVRPFADLIRRCKRDTDGRKRKWILRLFEEVENVLHGHSKCLPWRIVATYFAAVAAGAAAAPVPAFAATSRAMSSIVDSCFRGAFGSSISSTFKHKD